MSHDVCDVAGLESTVGRPPLPALMKSIDELDAHCAAILARAPVAVLVYLDADGAVRASAVGGEAGFARPETARNLALPTPATLPEDGSPAALLFLVPGWRESLRVNGRLRAGGLAVEEAFVHCGKAMIRSRLWSHRDVGAATPTPTPDQTTVSDRLDEAAHAFLAAAPFAVIGSCDAGGRADASPKGDPAGFVVVLDERTVAVPDRPGNRRTDTFHNVLARPGVALLALCPGDERSLALRGRARLSTDPALLARMAVQDQVPRVALVVDVEHVALQCSEVLQRADLWAPDAHVAADDLPRAATIWADHVKRNDRTGLAARAVRAGVSEAAVRAGIAVDYRQNLY